MPPTPPMKLWKKIVLWTLAIIAALLLLHKYPVSNDGVTVARYKPGFMILPHWIGTKVSNYFDDGATSTPYYVMPQAAPSTPTVVPTGGGSAVVFVPPTSGGGTLAAAKAALQPEIGPIVEEDVGGTTTKVSFLINGRTKEKIFLTTKQSPELLLAPPPGQTWERLDNGKGDGTTFIITRYP